MIKFYGKAIDVKKASASQDKKTADVGAGANLFLGNLDPDVDEKHLYDSFSALGVIVVNPKIMRYPDTGNSRGFGFISFDSFEASNTAIEIMNGKYLCNCQITVSYAYKKDTKGEQHGTPAERVLAATAAASKCNSHKNRPHTRFANGPPPLLPPPPPANAAAIIARLPPPPQGFSNGSVPPQSWHASYPTMQMPAAQSWQSQPPPPLPVGCHIACHVCRCLHY